MARYIDADKLDDGSFPEVTCEYERGWNDALEGAMLAIPTADVVEVVRCKDCKYHHWEQEPEHGKIIHLCSVLNAEVFKDFYCCYGTPKERGGEK